MIEQYIGIDSEYVVIGLVGAVALLLILWLVSIIQYHGLKKKYKAFMDGKNAKSLEEMITERIGQIDSLEMKVKDHERDINDIFKNLKYTFQKVGLVKYDAFNEMGGKLSFSLCMLNETNDGYIINAMHSREGCYTYIKEIIDGNSVIQLSDEEKEALNMAVKMDTKK
ncbi:MAG: DUF4446 family protein [Lachnospiraceae bacterium]|nr:DUF4446 family protein [Lachnospiraceae bacterium]